MRHKTIPTVILIILLLVIGFLFYYVYQTDFINEEDGITSFEKCVAVGYPVQDSYPRRCTAQRETFVEDIPDSDNVENYFVETLREKAIARVGMPIEGFTPALYITAFPALQKSDFDTNEAINGLWKFENNKLFFIPTAGGYVTSADGTLTDAGVKTLLKNVEARLGAEITTPTEVDEFIASLSFEVEQQLCTPGSRNADFCTTLYKPVCGWLDPEKIQCIRYPCAQTFSNSCFACMNDDVIAWTEGECPNG